MVVVCCYATLHPRTRESVMTWAPAAVFTDTSATPLAYWQTVERHWLGLQDVVIIEQDIEITAEVIPGFAGCAEPWCSYWYHLPPIRKVVAEADDAGSTAWAARIVAGAFRRMFGPMTTGLGCTKFSAALQADIPFAAICDTPPGWDVVDTAITGRLTKAGYAPHVHGQVTHHHDALTLCVHRGADSRRYSWHYAGYPTVSAGEL